ncbi:hypothetical protein [Lederbergia panacisoli]|uniref:hypothetical protein n=1 Tax=Lederbergia panacisoli TaxID=1255251 RepID=UPI00214BBE3A|nr:hypothetical protein [Lederbergia panacisoli]MCR2821104.1 hypothetical protein [Lederbergia panacisoli]
MEHFPIIHTNFWDAVIAVPLVVIVTQIIKISLRVPRFLVPTIATVLGLIFSIFIAHKYNFWAAVFMGFFYGNAAVGVYAGLKTSIDAYRKQKKE